MPIRVSPSLIIQIAKGIIRDQHVRRSAMFYGLLVALVMLFIGSTLLDRWLKEHPLLFLLYWFACAWVTLAAILLALFDLLMIRAAHRQARRQLKKEMLHTRDADPSHDENSL